MVVWAPHHQGAGACAASISRAAAVERGPGRGAMDRQASLASLLSCDATVAATLIGQGSVREIGARAVIVHQGDHVGAIWLILGGRIALESASAAGRSSRLGAYGPGDWVGNYLRPAPCRADIVALEPVTLLSFPSGRLPELAAGVPQLGLALASSFARQLEATLDKLDARSTLTSKGRIYAELIRRADGGLSLAPPPVVADLAQAAQTTRETASRAIGELERRGIVERDAQSLRIISPRLLAELAV